VSLVDVFPVGVRRHHLRREGTLAVAVLVQQLPHEVEVPLDDPLADGSLLDEHLEGLAFQ